VRAAHHRLLLSGVRRPRAAAAAREAADYGYRDRTPRRETVDDQGAQQRRAASSPRHSPESTRRAARAGCVPLTSRAMPATSARIVLLATVLLSWLAAPCFAQQRPLLTEDPEPIGAGRILVEGGLDYQY